MSKQIDDAKAELAHYASTKDPEQLESAIRSLEHADLLEAETGAERLAMRLEVGQLWMGAFEALTSGIDPAFDPEDRPQMNLVPPPGRNQAYSSGVSPTAIREPEIRAAYEADLQKNKEKVESRRIQNRLRLMEDRAAESVERFIRRFYTLAQADRTALTELVNRAKVAPKTRERFLAVSPR
jgi:hypothetical protein